MKGRIFIGTSGWNYKSWAAGVFYPNRLKPADWFAPYSGNFGSVEVNNTFFHLPQKSVFESWYRQTPPEFVFALKASRFITHMKKLSEPRQHVTLFLRRASGLREKLQVVLFQLPPFWKYNPDRLEKFCSFVSK